MKVKVLIWYCSQVKIIIIWIPLSLSNLIIIFSWSGFNHCFIIFGWSGFNHCFGFKDDGLLPINFFGWSCFSHWFGFSGDRGLLLIIFFGWSGSRSTSYFSSSFGYSSWNCFLFFPLAEWEAVVVVAATRATFRLARVYLLSYYDCWMMQHPLLTSMVRS